MREKRGQANGSGPWAYLALARGVAAFAVPAHDLRCAIQSCIVYRRFGCSGIHTSHLAHRARCGSTSAQSGSSLKNWMRSGSLFLLRADRTDPATDTESSPDPSSWLPPWLHTKGGKFEGLMAGQGTITYEGAGRAAPLEDGGFTRDGVASVPSALAADADTIEEARE